MKSTQIIKSIDFLGRFKIPKEIRLSLNIKDGSPLVIYQKRKSIILDLSERKCIFCDSTENIHNFKNDFVCTNCINRIKNDIMSKNK